MNTARMISIGEYEQDDNTQNPTVNEIEESLDWLLQRVRIPPDGGQKFCKQIRNNNATTGGDESYKKRKATGGSLSFDVGIRIDNKIPIDPSDASAYAGELGGIGGIVAATNILCKKFQVRAGTVTHGVDNDAALANCFGPYEPTTLTPCFHIVKRIRAAIKKSSVKWIGKKVKAHQDENTEFDQLDCWAKANILADKQAKAHLRRVLGQETRSSIQQFENEGWTIQIGTKRITRRFEKQIIYHCTKKDIKRYWCNRFEINQEYREDIDWNVFVKATKEMTVPQQIFIMKHAAGISATGRNMLRRKEHETSQCPRCKQEDEHTDHIFTCKGAGTKEVFNTGITELSMWLEKTTSREMGKAVTEFINRHRQEQITDWSDWKGTDAIKDALIAQEQIGASAFLSGIVTSKWATAQRLYLDRIESRKCETKWTATLTLKIIDLVEDLWKHRNDALHNRDNVVREKDHERLNNEIESCIRELPRNLRVLTLAEQRFFQRTKIQKLKQCKIKRKQQWITTAKSIITGFRENLHSNPQARTMWRALNLLPSQHRQTIDNQNTEEETRKQEHKNSQRSEQHTNKYIEYTTQQGAESTKQNKTNEEENNRNRINDKTNRSKRHEIHEIQNTEDKNDMNDPNG